ncbi:SIS domain-containing protein [uncultured Tateyamaria sp.]|uniref:SIS domain-containing protein n=1 Tax=uncultured Tateyamaria sp. TaxID=455651 RepID=UPI00261500CA|nr:SIS domain-containing protein [uncultured Tateyamaria sp.]
MSPTFMRREIDEIPEAARRLTDPATQDAFKATAAALRAHDPRAIVTIARGSSDHAATCLKYAFELVAGVPVASLGPSVATIYGAQLRFDRVTALGISQSGQSSDLVQMMESAALGGAQTITLTNHSDSPLAAAATHVLDIHAGPEQAVAATKSYTNSILTGLWLAAHWQQDDALIAALLTLPDRLDTALENDVSRMTEALIGLDRLVVLSRGPTLGIACEVALKAMEVCAIPAISYSSAEVLHGPSAVLKHGYPVLPIPSNPGSGLTDTLGILRAQGASILPTVSGAAIPHSAMPALDALDALVPLYGALEAVSLRRGLNPDKPVGLAKVTNTV